MKQHPQQPKASVMRVKSCYNEYDEVIKVGVPLHDTTPLKTCLPGHYCILMDSITTFIMYLHSEKHLRIIVSIFLENRIHAGYC